MSAESLPWKGLIMKDPMTEPTPSHAEGERGIDQS